MRGDPKQREEHSSGLYPNQLSSWKSLVASTEGQKKSEDHLRKNNKKGTKKFNNRHIVTGVKRLLEFSAHRWNVWKGYLWFGFVRR